MNINTKNIAAVLLVILFAGSCKKNTETLSTRLLITLKDRSGLPVTGVSLRLYKNETDPGITQLSDANGVVYFTDLDPVLYFWSAEKNCFNNKNSQSTFGKALISGVVLYGNSILSETGTLKIINNAADSFRISDSIFSRKIPGNTILFVYPSIGMDTIRYVNLNLPGIVHDTAFFISCTDTSTLVLP